VSRLSHRRIVAALENGDAAQTSPERGKCLENLIVYVFCRLVGLRFVEMDVRTANGGEELDVVLWNDRQKSDLSFLDDVLLFECKNWTQPVNSAAVSFFLQKVRRRHLTCGFLIAASGITGDENEKTAAYGHVDDALVQDGIRLVVIERAEMCSLLSTEALVELIQDKIAKVVMRAA
jgi:hypothetical protein